MHDHAHPSAGELAGAARRAMRWSLAAGVLMLAGKVGAYYITGSAAILSDALESVIHVVAVGFAAYSLWLSQRPANNRFHYGFERITFFSAGFEGAMIVLAAVAIIAVAVEKWLTGIQLEQLGVGTLAVAGAAGVNGLLGWYLLRTGRRSGSLILEANGKHVLTDCWTSAGVIVGLLLVLLTGWRQFDPICAILVALNILWSGGNLMLRSARGLLDYASPEVGRLLRGQLDATSQRLGIQYHGVRFRETGGRLLVEVHLLFPFDMPLGRAHALATEVESDLRRLPGLTVETTTHLEALEDHGAVHRDPHYTGRPE